MFTSIGLFNTITCPASSCHLVNCLFSHEKKHHPLSLDSLTSSPWGGNGVEEAADMEDVAGVEKVPHVKEDPDLLKKKRKKPEIESGDLASQVVLKKIKLARDDVHDLPPSSNPTRELIRKPVSPPPLKSRRMDGSPISQHLPASTVPSTSKNTTPKVKESTSEALNPRLISKPPASHKLRLQLVTLLHAEMVRLDHLIRDSEDPARWTLRLSSQELITGALNEEEKTAVANSVIYTNLMKNRIAALRKMKLEEWKKERLKQIARLLPQDSSKVEPDVRISTGLSAAEEIIILQTLITPTAHLSNYGYVPSSPTPADIERARAGVDAAQGWEECDRCHSRFQVFPTRRPSDGALTSGGRCTYHYGKARRPPKQAFDSGARDPLYSCCGATVGTPGCTIADTHVFKVSEAKRLALIMPFAPTPERDDVPASSVVAFDCEMGYTTLGLELIRLTATDWPSGKILVDVLVRPLGAVLDLNSRFSGVWPHHYAEAKPLLDTPLPLSVPSSSTVPSSSSSAATASSLSTTIPSVPSSSSTATTTAPVSSSSSAATATTTTTTTKPKPTTAKPSSSSSSSSTKSPNHPPPPLSLASSPSAARALLLTHLTPQTPLLGHALDNDLNATRLIHPTLVDTALLFPHPAGLPVRHALKVLARRHLAREIQIGGARGHDSAEDATVAGELVRWMVGERWKGVRREGARFEDGVLVMGSPGR